MISKLMTYLKPDSTLYFIIVFGVSALFWSTAFFIPVEILPGLPLSALMAFCPGRRTWMDRLCAGKISK